MGKRTRAKRAGKRAKGPEQDEILLLIPGYDPFASAGDCWFDAAAAGMAVAFIEACCTHVKGELGGQPFRLERWQKAIVMNLFGWKRPDGTRRYREVFIYVPRKNGKTALAAALILVFLILDGEPGAEIYSAAADRDQAALVFDQVKGMIGQEPELRSRLKVYRNAVTYQAASASYKVLSADAHTKHGFNTHAAVIDELHAQPNRDLVDVLMTSTGARRQPCVIFITTADFDRPSICNEKHDYAGRVRDGLVEDPSFLPCIYEATADDDWTSPKTWRKANPNLAVSVSEDYLARECRRAMDSPAYENTFKRLHLNQKTTNDVAFLKMDAWDACGKARLLLASLRRRPCFGGLDLSTTTDLTAFVLIFPPADEGGTIVVVPFVWVPEETAVRREREDRVPYPLWVKQGLMWTTPGPTVRYDYVRRDINRIGRLFNVRKIGADRWNATQLIGELAGDGFEIEPFGQGFASMSDPTKELEKLVLERRLSHGGHPVLRWAANNLTVEQDAAGNLKPSKAKSTERIDPMVGLIMALGVWQKNPIVRSVYETRGMLIL